MFQQWRVFERLSAGQSLAALLFPEDFPWESGTSIQVQQHEKKRGLLDWLPSVTQAGDEGWESAPTGFVALHPEYNRVESPVSLSAK